MLGLTNERVQLKVIIFSRVYRAMRTAYDFMYKIKRRNFTIATSYVDTYLTTL